VVDEIRVDSDEDNGGVTLPPPLEGVEAYFDSTQRRYVIDFLRPHAALL
jgi:hypothetical protein